MNKNKNVSIWRGDTPPPSKFHLWLKNNKLYHNDGIDWIENEIDNASNESDGLMSKEDKKRLDNIVYDGLDSNDQNRALSANLGNVLLGKIETIKLSAYKVKGSVENISDISLIDIQLGDVYNVLNSFYIDNKKYPEGTNVVWTGTQLDPLGGTVDFKDYSTTEQIEEIVTTLENNINNSLDNLNSIKSDKTYVNELLATKANTGYVNKQLATKADKTYVDTQLTTKANTTYVDNKVSPKADKTYVDTQLATKANATYVDWQLATKANKTDVDEIDANLNVVITTVEEHHYDIANIKEAISLENGGTSVELEMSNYAIPDSQSLVIGGTIMADAGSRKISNGILLEAGHKISSSDTNIHALLEFAGNTMGRRIYRVLQVGSLNYMATEEKTVYVCYEPKGLGNTVKVGLATRIDKLESSINDSINSINSNISDINSSKASITYVDNKVSPKADKTYVDGKLATKADKTYVDNKTRNVTHIMTADMQYMGVAFDRNGFNDGVYETSVDVSSLAVGEQFDYTEAYDNRGNISSEITLYDGETIVVSSEYGTPVLVSAGAIKEVRVLPNENGLCIYKCPWIDEAFCIFGYGAEYRIYKNSAVLDLASGEFVGKAELDSVKESLEGSIQQKSDKTYVDGQLATKASTTYVDNKVSPKADKTYVDGQLKTINTKLQEEITRATNAESTINAKVEAEITRATNVENNLRETINNITAGPGQDVTDILARLQGTSINQDGYKDPVFAKEFTGDAAISNLNTWLNNQFFAIKDGVYYRNGQSGTFTISKDVPQCLININCQGVKLYVFNAPRSFASGTFEQIAIGVTPISGGGGITWGSGICRRQSTYNFDTQQATWSAWESITSSSAIEEYVDKNIELLAKQRTSFVTPCFSDCDSTHEAKCKSITLAGGELGFGFKSIFSVTIKIAENLSLLNQTPTYLHIKNLFGDSIGVSMNGVKQMQNLGKYATWFFDSVINISGAPIVLSLHTTNVASSASDSNLVKIIAHVNQSEGMRGCGVTDENGTYHTDWTPALGINVVNLSAIYPQIKELQKYRMAYATSELPDISTTGHKANIKEIRINQNVMGISLVNSVSIMVASDSAYSGALQLRVYDINDNLIAASNNTVNLSQNLGKYVTWYFTPFQLNTDAIYKFSSWSSGTSQVMRIHVASGKSEGVTCFDQNNSPHTDYCPAFGVNISAIFADDLNKKIKEVNLALEKEISTNSGNIASLMTTKASTTYVDEKVSPKADKTYVIDKLDARESKIKTYVDNQIDSAKYAAQREVWDSIHDGSVFSNVLQLQVGSTIYPYAIHAGETPSQFGGVYLPMNYYISNVDKELYLYDNATNRYITAKWNENINVWNVTNIDEGLPDGLPEDTPHYPYVLSAAGIRYYLYSIYDDADRWYNELKGRINALEARIAALEAK